MVRAIRAIQKWWMVRKIRKDVLQTVADLNFLVYSVLQEKEKAEKKLDNLESRLEKTEEKRREEHRKLKQAISEAKGTNRRMENALEAANEHLKTLEEIVIPGLIAANHTFVNSWDAQNSLQAMRTVAAERIEEQEA